LYPIALQFGARLGPWLGRAAAANKGLLPTLVARLRAGKAIVGDKVADIVAWARSNPGNAVMLASTLTTLGLYVGDALEPSDDPSVVEFRNGLLVAAQKAADQINAIGSNSETAKFGSDSEDRKIQDEVQIEVLSWARGFFGSTSSAIEAHRMLQAFVEMPLGEVRHGFAIYKLR